MKKRKKNLRRAREKESVWGKNEEIKTVQTREKERKETKKK